MDNENKLMLGLPKGSLEESTIRLFAKAGYQITKSSRSYRPSFDDSTLDGRFLRAQRSVVISKMAILIVVSRVRIG